mmetsp:Transcript_130210/g.324665  ORF Transcript_130210/g.324665 Transcript_130210/m.324665 type:complete len:259 (+) Transcript_130210:263-1039(+)
MVHSSNVYSLDVRQEELVQLLDSFPPCAHPTWQPACFPLIGCEQLLLGWWVIDVRRFQLCPSGCVGEAIHHVRACPLVPVHLTILRPPLLITTVSVRSAVPRQSPLQEGKRLGMCELARAGTTDDVGIANSGGPAVGRHFDGSTGLYEGPESSEEQVHQVCVPPTDKWVTIEEARNNACMWKIVVDSSELLFHALEAWIDSQTCTINIVQNLCAELLQRLDRLVNFSVALPKGLTFLESGRHCPTNMVQRFTMLCQLQ